MTVPCRVLVIEDDEDIRESMDLVLSDEGHEVTCASNGEEALALLVDEGARPGLILLDLMMPVMDGIQFRAAQLASPALRDIPVVIISADTQLRVRAAELQVSGHFQKPVDLRTLYRIVDEFCSHPHAPG